MIGNPVDYETYADVSQHSRIRDLTQHVQRLRVPFEKSWKPQKVKDDQRCVYAICTYDNGEDYGDWCKDFDVRVRQMVRDGGQSNCQSRYDLYKRVRHLWDESRGTTMFGQDQRWKHPSEYQFDADMDFQYCVVCFSSQMI